MGSTSSSVATTFTLSNLSYTKSGKRKNNEKEIISSILALAPSSTLRKISQQHNSQSNNKSKYNTQKKEIDQNPDITNGDTQTLAQRKSTSTKHQQSNSKNNDDVTCETEETKDNLKSNKSDEYTHHVLPLIIGDTVHILDQEGLEISLCTSQDDPWPLFEPEKLVLHHLLCMRELHCSRSHCFVSSLHSKYGHVL